MHHDVGDLGRVRGHQLRTGVGRRPDDVLFQLLLGAGCECPGGRRPVACVLPHRREERHQIRAQVAEHREEAQRDGDEDHCPRHRRICECVAVPCRVAPEEEDRCVGEQEVPFERHREGERREDEQVEAHHQHHRGECEPLVGREQQDQRRRDFDDGAEHVTDTACDLRRSKVVGEVAVVRALEGLDRQPRRIRHHRRDDHREVVSQFGNACADPHRDDQQLQREDHVDEGQDAEEDQSRQVLLTTRCDEDDLVAQTDDDQQCDHGVDQNRVDQAVRGGCLSVEPARLHTRKHQCDNGCDQK